MSADRVTVTRPGGPGSRYQVEVDGLQWCTVAVEYVDDGRFQRPDWATSKARAEKIAAGLRATLLSTGAPR